MLPASGIMVFYNENRPETKNTQRMLPPERLDRIHVAFVDHRLVANAGVLLPVTLAHHLGLGELVDRHVDLGRALGRANTGDKMLTLVASALTGGDCINAAAVLRADRCPASTNLAENASTIFAGSPPRPQQSRRVAVLRQSGSWGRQTPG